MGCCKQHHKTRQASHVHQSLQLGQVWALMADYPVHATAIGPNMRCILDGHSAQPWMAPDWSSPVCSLHTGPAAARRRLAPLVHAVLHHEQRGDAAVCPTTTAPDTRWSHHPPGHRAAPCGLWPCKAISNLSMPLCSVMQRQ
jgi:hypothetical protein